MIATSGQYEFSWVQFFCTTAIFLAAIQNYYVGQINLEPPETIIEFMIKNILSPAALYIAAYQVFPQHTAGVRMIDFIIEAKWRILIPTIFYLLFTILNAAYDYDGLEIYQWAPHITGVALCLLSGLSNDKRLFTLAVVFINLMVVAFFLVRYAI